jgi:hypothetical protein
MKTQFLALVLILSSLTAFAGNEGPQAAPVLPPKLIAQLVTGSGFGPPSMPAVSTINVLENGKVQATDRYRDGHVTVEELAQLSPMVLAKLQTLVNSTVAGELVDPSPEFPGCMDAPSTTYYAILADGTKIAVAGQQQCKELQKSNATSSDYQIESILKGFISLANIL